MDKNSISPIGYISLKEATEIFGYHPDYLSYLMRKGKIKGKRIGRDWFTTKDAVQNYLLTKKFFPLKEILFSKIKPRIILFLGIAAIGISIAVFLISSPLPSFQEVKGDFGPQKLQTESVGIDSTIEWIKEVKVTTYSSDEIGGIEISIQPESAIPKQPEKISAFQKIKQFFNKIFK